MSASVPVDRPELSAVELPDAGAWRAWLEEHPDSPGLWLRIAKRGAPRATVSYPEAVRVALCFGWIDSQKRPLDDAYWLQRFTPRGPRSRWSKLNRELAERLIAAGEMHPRGLAEVEAARADGRWDAAYAPASQAAVPEDFARALEQHPDAKAFFETLTGTNRYAFLYRIADAKRPETRARRIERFVAMLRAGETLHPGS